VPLQPKFIITKKSVRGNIKEKGRIESTAKIRIIKNAARQRRAESAIIRDKTKIARRKKKKRD